MSETTSVAVDGAELFVVRDGEPAAPAVMLFSGAGCNTRMWEPVLGSLAARFDVVRHDVRGSGRSRAAPDAARDLDRLADDAAAILDALGVERCVAWGMAFGARVALAFAARHPERVSRLVLADASVEPPEPERQRDSLELAARERERLGIAQPLRPPEWFTHDDGESLRRTLRAVYAPADHDRYPPLVTAPTLIATGELDPNLEPSRRLCTRLADCRLQVVAAAGHGSVIERPELCLSLFDAFLAERDGSRPATAHRI